MRKQKHNYKPFYTQEKHSRISGEPHVLTRSKRFLNSSVPHRESHPSDRQPDQMGLLTGSPYCPVTYWRWEDQEMTFGPQSTTVAPVQPSVSSVRSTSTKDSQDRSRTGFYVGLPGTALGDEKDWLDKQTSKLIDPHRNIYMYKNNILRW